MKTSEIMVGVGVFIFRGNNVLLGHRTGAHGADTWALPGGRLELDESVEDCARREVLEETGLILTSVTKCGFSDDVLENDGVHCITLYVTAMCAEGEVENREPEYCKEWQWFDLDNLPSPLFLPLHNFLLEESDIAKVIS